MTTIIDPSGSQPSAARIASAPRPKTLRGGKLAVLDNGKPNAAHVVATAARGVRQRYGAAEPMAVTKDVASRPVSEELLVRFTGFDAAIVGVGD